MPEPSTRYAAYPPQHCLSVTAAGIAEALLTTALGMLVAVPTVWCYNYFSHVMDDFEIEIHNTSLELVSYLSTHRSGQA